MRESLFDKLKNQKICYIVELRKIFELIADSYRAGSYFSSAFKSSPYNIYYVDFDTAAICIFQTKLNLYYDGYGSILSRIDYAIQSGTDVTLDCFLNYLEFFSTLFDVRDNQSYDANYNQIKMLINADCEKLGYIFTKDNNGAYRVRIKDELAEGVALKVKEETRDKIYSYLTIRQGDVNKKRESIKSLADDVELICKKREATSEYKKLRQFIQCTRHTKDNPKKEFPFYYKSEEKWLDKTFDMIIGVLAFEKAKEVAKEITDLESSINEKI